MSVELAEAYISLIPSLRGTAGIVRSELAATEVQAAATSAGGVTGARMAAGVKAMVAPALALLSVGAITDFVGDAVNDFSELEDASGAASVVFGDSMRKITDQSKTAAATMGMSQDQVIAAANMFGTYGKSAGLAGDDLAAFSTKMTGLAGDLASFKGGTPEEAVEAIGAALRGEMEPIRKYGVLLDDASLRSQALKMGLIKTTKEALTPQQKVLAAQALILKQTTDAQGDFVRTQDSTANVQKRLTAESKNLSEKLGGMLAPAFTVVREAITQALSGLSGALDWISANGPIVTSVLAGMAAAVTYLLAPAIWTAVKATLAWTGALLTNPITWIVVGIAALVAGLVLLWQNWDTVTAWITQVWGQFTSWLGGIWNTIAAGVSGFGTQIASFFSGMWTGIVNTATGAWNGLVAWFGGLWGLIGPVFSGVWESMQTYVATVLSVIIAIFTGRWGEIPGLILSGATKILGFLIAGFAPIVSFLGRTWDGIKATAQSIWNGLVAWVQGIPGRILDGINGLAVLGGKAAAWFGGVLTAAKDKLGDVVNWVKGVPDKIVDALGKVGTLLYNAGKNIMQGFLDGLKSIWDNITSWVGKIADWIKDHKGPISYDATLLVPHGRAIMSGLDEGLQAETGWRKTIGSVADSIAGLRFATPGGGTPALAGAASGGDNWYIYEAVDATHTAAEVSRRQLLKRG